MSLNGDRKLNIMIIGKTGITFAEYGVENGTIREESKGLIPPSIDGTTSLFTEWGKGRSDILTSSQKLINSTRYIVSYDLLEDLGKDNPFGIEDMRRLYALVQVEGSNITDYERKAYEEFANLLLKETALRYLTKEVSNNKEPQPATCIEILNQALNKLSPGSKDKLLVNKSDYLERIVDKELNELLNNETSILELMLRKVPLIEEMPLKRLKKKGSDYSRDSFTQEDYEELISECKEFAQQELDSFQQVIDDVAYSNEIKLYGKNSFSEVVQEYDAFNERRNLIEAKKELLINIIKDLNPKFEELGCQKLQGLLPAEESLDQFIQEVRKDILNGSEPTDYLIKGGESITLKKIRESTESIIIKNKKKDSELLKLKQLINSSAQLIDDLARYVEEMEFHSIKGYFYELCQEPILEEQERQHADNQPIAPELFDRFAREMGSEELFNSEGFVPIPRLASEDLMEKKLQEKEKKKQMKSIKDYGEDFRKGYYEKVNSLEKNLEGIIISRLYDRVFNDYRNFQYIIRYSGSAKGVVYEKTRDCIKDFVNNIQDYGFPAVLSRLLQGIKTSDIVKQISISLLQNYLKSFLHEHFKKDPFIKKRDGNQIIAFDSYSLSFCSEIIKRVGLNEDLYNEIDSASLPQFYKEQFIQLLDNTGLTKIGVATELQQSQELFDNWKQSLEDKIKDLLLGKLSEEVLGYISTFDSVLQGSDELFNDWKRSLQRKISDIVEPEEFSDEVSKEVSKEISEALEPFFTSGIIQRNVFIGSNELSEKLLASFDSVLQGSRELFNNCKQGLEDKINDLKVPGVFSKKVSGYVSTFDSVLQGSDELFNDWKRSLQVKIKDLDLPEKLSRGLLGYISTFDSVLQGYHELFNDWKQSLEDKIKGLKVPGVSSKKGVKYVVTIDSIIEKSVSMFDYKISARKGSKKYKSEEARQLERSRILKKDVLLNLPESNKKLIFEKYSNPKQILLTINNLETVIHDLENTAKENKKIIEENKKLKKHSEKELLIESFAPEEIIDLINDFKAVLADEYRSDVKTVKKVSQDIDKLMKAKDFEEINNLVHELLGVLNSAKSVIDKKEKLTEIHDSLTEMVAYKRLEATIKDLDNLNNEFLKLPNYTHVKGMLRTVINPGELVKEAKVEDKNRSEDLLMQSLVNTYADLQEAYYGSFKTESFSRGDPSLRAKFKLRKPARIEVLPGKYLKEQYVIASEELKKFNGVNFLKGLLEACEKIKVRVLNPGFLINYLLDYGSSEFSSLDDFLKSLSDPKFFKDFADKGLVSFNELKPKLKQQADDYWNAVESFLKGDLKKKPEKPFELGVLNSTVIRTLDKILENVNNNASLIQKSFYITGTAEGKDHPALLYNLKEASLKKIETLKKGIDHYGKEYDKIVNKLKRKMSKFKTGIVDYDAIVSSIETVMQKAVIDQLRKWKLDEIELWNINKIRIRSSLDPIRYVIPEETERRLPTEKRHRDYYEKLINVSTDISRKLKQRISEALYENKVFNELLSRPVSAKDNDLLLTVDLEIPESINKGDLKKFFEEGITFEGSKAVIGLKLPFKALFRNGEDQNFGNALKNHLSDKLVKELEPGKNFLQDYSSKVHTRFSTAADELELTEFIQKKPN